MVDNDNRRTPVAGPPRNWLAYAIGALVLLLVLILALRSCSTPNRDDQNSLAASNSDATTAAAADGAANGADSSVATSPAGADGADASAFTVEGMRDYLQAHDTADAAGRHFGLDRVTFDTGSAKLDAQDQAEIGKVAEVLKQFPQAGVTITGYADPAGTAPDNKKLAAQRAVAVKEALGQAGIPAARLKTDVVGETGTEAVRANRRVDLLVQR